MAKKRTKKYRLKRGNPVAKARATGEHGPAARQKAHRAKNKYTRKKKHKGRSQDQPFFFVL